MSFYGQILNSYHNTLISNWIWCKQQSRFQGNRGFGGNGGSGFDRGMGMGGGGGGGMPGQGGMGGFGGRPPMGRGGMGMDRRREAVTPQDDFGDMKRMRRY